MEYKLYHYGILGMKWGIRRFQNEDGSLKPAGEKRYATNVSSQKEKARNAQRAAKEAASGMYTGKEGAKKYAKATGSLFWEREKLANEKVKEKLNQENGKKSKHRTALEEKYRKQGMSQEEAEIAAYKRVRTEKILAAAAGVTVVAAGAYIAKKEYDRRADKLIPAGTELQRITSRDITNDGVRDGFYFSMDESDNRKYRGMLGEQLRFMRGQAFETKLTTKQGMKVASEKHAIDALKELAKEDTGYTKELSQYLGKMATATKGDLAQRLNNASRKAADGTIDRDVYEALNTLMTDHSDSGGQFHDKFYRKLTEKGYNAIMDVNDKKYSGYNAKRPMIAFNAKNMVDVKSVRQLSREEVTSTATSEFLKIQKQNQRREDAPKMLGKMGAGVAAAGVVKSLPKVRRNKVISDYRKEHPNSKLSNQEILDNYYES